MALIYATATDYTNWTSGDAPDNVDKLLRSASGLVQHYTRAAVYRTDSEGLPTDEPVATAFRDATASQATYWAANSIDPTAGSLAEVGKKVATKKSIKGASVEYDATATLSAVNARVQAVTTLCDEAALILANAGLVTNHIVPRWRTW